MQTEQQNYGVEEGPGAENIGTAVSARDERTWSVLSHLSIFLNLFTGFLGPVASLIVWLVYKDRSRTVSFQAVQSAIYQGVWLVILAAGWTITGLLTFILAGFLLVPGMAVLTVFPFLHSVYAAYKVSQGEDYRYPFVADLIENR
jgi:uncharacterized Tic20 family protein